MAPGKGGDTSQVLRPGEEGHGAKGSQSQMQNPGVRPHAAANSCSPYQVQVHPGSVLTSAQLQRVLRRAGLADTSGKGSQSVPVSSPSSIAPDSGATSSSHHSRGTNHVVIPRVNLATPSAPKGARVQKNGKQTKFLAKQFKLISNNANATPRRNIKILAKDPSEVMVVAEKMERYQLQERIRAHDCDKSDPSDSIDSALRLDALSGASKMRSTSEERHSMDRALANSPRSVISEVVSVSETDMSSVENEATDHLRLTSFSITRERWTSREIFGSFDIGGELDIVAGSVAEATYPESSGYDDQDRFSSCQGTRKSPTP